MTSKLAIDQTFEGYVIGWSEDGEIGSYVGEFKNYLTDFEDDREKFEIETTEKIAAEDTSAEYRRGKWHWDSLSSAKKALASMRLALKQDRPMPDWATKALSEGWKAPKGWKA